MNDRIPLKFRLLAAGFYVIGAMPTALIFAILLLLTFGGSIVTMITYLLTGAYIFLVVASLITWLKNRELHPFADRSRREAINYVLNNLLAMLFCLIFCTFVFTMTCGIGKQDMTPLLTSLLIFAGIMIAYFINSMVAAIFALRGHGFKSRLIYPFIRSE